MSSSSVLRTSPPLASPCSSSSALPLRRGSLFSCSSPAKCLGSRGRGVSFSVPRASLDGAQILGTSSSKIVALKLNLLVNPDQIPDKKDSSFDCHGFWLAERRNWFKQRPRSERGGSQKGGRRSEGSGSCRRTRRS